MANAPSSPNQQQLLHLTEGRYGRFLVSPRDEYIGYSAMLYGEYASKEIVLLKQLLPPDSGPYTVIDAGANIGFHSVPLAQYLRGTGGTLYAYEPQRIMFQILCANLMLNECFNAQTRQEGLGSESTTMYIPDIPLDIGHPINYGCVQLVDEKNKDNNHFSVPVRRLDDVGFEKVDLIKVDVEQMEIDVLRGAHETIQRDKPDLYVENDRTPLAVALIEYLHSIGYKCWWHVVSLYREDNFNKVKHNIFGNLASINMLCLHESKKDKIQNLQSDVAVFQEVDLANPLPSWYPQQ